MRPGDIYLAHFPFGDIPGMKLRPVLLLTGRVGGIPEVLVAYISSVIPAQFRSTHLKTASALRLHKLATIHRSSLARYLGVIDSLTQGIVAGKLKELLKL
jgi:hypothetical protein